MGPGWRPIYNSIMTSREPNLPAETVEAHKKACAAKMHTYEDPFTQATVFTEFYLLDRGFKFGLERLGGVEAAEAIFANTYRGAFVEKTGTQLNHWQSALHLAANTPVFRARRTMEPDHFSLEAEALLDHAMSVTAAQGETS